MGIKRRNRLATEFARGFAHDPNPTVNGWLQYGVAEFCDTVQE
jgi:hypothetical protein